MYRTGRRLATGKHASKRIEDCAEITVTQPKAVGGSGHRKVRRVRPSGRGRHPVVQVSGPTPRLIGREAELRYLRLVLRRKGTLLVTLTGPPGVGKTSLAVSAATQTARAFEHGVWLIDLAPLSDPMLVPQAIARRLQVRERGGRSLLDELRNFLRHRSALLVLDNFEHVVDAAPQVAALLSDCPSLKVLVTSRQPLRLSSEQVFEVPRLGVPNLAHLPPIDQLLEFPAAALFVERARATQPGFTLSAESARAVAEVWVRLDGLPLAIVLAAARTNVLSVDAMLDRLQQRFTLLRVSSRDLPVRHLTLFAAIAWSYDLLAPAEQQLFHWLALFPGGCTLRAADHLGEDENPDARVAVVDVLESLLDKHLTHREERSGVPRFFMLESIREYALHVLGTGDAFERLRRRQVAYYLPIVEDATALPLGLDQATWFDELEHEHHNILNVLAWALDGDAEAGVRMAVALGWYWYIRGDLSVGRHWLERAVAVSRTLSPRTRAHALFWMGTLARRQGDYAEAAALCRESLQLCREVGDDPGAIDALKILANIAWRQADYASAKQFAEEGLRLAQGREDKAAIASVLVELGLVARRQGEYLLATGYFEQSLEIYRQLGELRWVGFMLNNLGLIARAQGDLAAAAATLSEAFALMQNVKDRYGMALVSANLGVTELSRESLHQAEALCERSLNLFEELQDRSGIAHASYNLGLVALSRGQYARAATLIVESLTQRLALQESYGIAECLEALARIALAGRQNSLSAMLYASAAATRDAIGAPLPPLERERDERDLAVLRSRLQAGYHDRLAEGARLTVAQAADLARSVAVPATARLPRSPATSLTRREQEIVRLITEGASNRQIAAQLTISEKTVAAHVQNILNKLGFDSRTQVAAWATRREPAQS